MSSISLSYANTDVEYQEIANLLKVYKTARILKSSPFYHVMTVTYTITRRNNLYFPIAD